MVGGETQKGRASRLRSVGGVLKGDQKAATKSRLLCNFPAKTNDAHTPLLPPGPPCCHGLSSRDAVCHGPRIRRERRGGTHIRTHVRTHIHTHLHTHAQSHTRSQSHIHTYTCTHTHTHAHTHTCTHTRSRSQTQTQTHTCACTRARPCAYAPSFD